MSESNTLPFVVLGDAAAPPHVGVEIEIYAHDEPTRRIDVIADRWDVTLLDEIGKPGGGSFSLWRNDPKLLANPAILDWRNIVRMRINHRTVGAFLVQSKKSDFVSAAEESGDAWNVMGEGLRTWFHDAVVLPYAGLKAKSSGSRVFSFASERGSWYKEAQWHDPIRAHKYTMDPGPTNPWGTAPAEWPDVPEAYWVWGVAQPDYTAPVGYNYFRYEFTVLESMGTATFSVFSAADNAYQGYIDGQEIISVDSESWQRTTRADFEISPGEHVLAFRVMNSGGPGSLLAAMFRAGDAAAGTPAQLKAFTGDELLAQRLTEAQNNVVSAQNSYNAAQSAYDAAAAGAVKDAALLARDAAQATLTAQQEILITLQTWNTTSLTMAGRGAWKVNPYPDPAPGWTAGEIMLTLLTEAEDRGVQFPSFLNPTFTAEVDSDGAVWSRALDWSFSIGMEYSEVIERLEEAVCDLWIDPETLDLNMYMVRGTDRTIQSSAVAPIKFEVGRNVLRAHEEGVSDVKNTLALSTNDGWLLQAGGVSESFTKYGRVEGTLNTGLSSSVSGDVANAVFGMRSVPAMSSTYEIIDVDYARPFVEFSVGDWVLTPGVEGIPVRSRILSLAVTEDAKTGAPKYATEFGSITEDQTTRHERWLKTLSNQSLGGTVANSAGGTSGSTANGAQIPSQATSSGPMGMQGPAGPAGVVWKGAWAGGTSYAKYDMVGHDGSSWVAEQESRNVVPASGSYWSLVALGGAGGSDGTDGTNGADGVDGVDGVDGSDGDSAYTQAVANGFVGTVAQWLDSLHGSTGSSGESTYQIAVAEGYVGTEAAWLLTLRGPKGDIGATGALADRLTATVTTPSIPIAGSWSGLIDMAIGWRLYRVTTNRPARVRLYGTTARRDADAARPIGTDPSGDHGLLFEYVTTAGTLTQSLSPLVDGASFEDTPTSAVPVTIGNNDSSAGVVTLTFIYVRTE